MSDTTSELWVHPECAMKQQYPGHACTNYGDCPSPHKATPADVLAAARALPGAEVLWTCREQDQIHDWAIGSPPHCWFRGEAGHYPECGEYLVIPLSDEEEK